MTRKLFRRVVTLVASLILTATTFFGIAAWRRSEDARWCRNATMRSTQADGTQSVTSDLLERERSACAVQRQRQRAMFGTFWRTGGQEMAECGFEWARFQMLSYEDPKAATAILKPYGIDEPDFDASSGDNTKRFIQACLATGRHAAG